MIKKDIEKFLLSKRGYIKKSPLLVAKAIWKSSDKHTLPKSKADVTKELEQIKEVQQAIRVALVEQTSDKDQAIMDTYAQIIADKNRPKRRLFFDLEVSANIVFSWRIGHNIDLSPDNIIQERAIICACYKWEGEDKVYSLKWNRGDDKELLEKFSKVIDSADEVITQNGDAFDIKWLRTRCIYHGIPVSPKFNSIDTLKMARSGFKFNSNKLDYMGQYLSLGKKIKTEYNLWKEIMLNNNNDSMRKMVDYCKQDVNLLESVYQKLQAFSPVKKFKYKP